MTATTHLATTGDPTIERTAQRLRLGALVALALVAVIALAGCAPTVGKIETNTTASAARRLGYSGVSSTQIQCSAVSTTTGSTTTVVKADCRNTMQACCIIPVTTTYKGSSATAVASFDATQLENPWYRDSGRVTVSCSWSKAGDAWTMTSCGDPKAVPA
jgi:hypothetical protein